MKHFINNKLTVASLLCASALVLGGCGGDSNNDDKSTGLPEGLSISLLNSATGAYYSFNSESDTRVDLNELARSSQDSAIQKLEITDPSTVGHFFHWPDFREVDGEEKLDMKYVLMKPGYEDGSTIDSTQMVQLTHFHDDTLAAHSADEFANPAAGSGKEQGLIRLNNHVEEQSDLEGEIAEVMPAGTELCRAFIDPYLAFEAEHKEHEEEEHGHGELVHYALDKTGRLYFFKEHEDGLKGMQGFVQLDDVTSIEDCSRTTISRASEDGVIVFVPDSQKLYLVDSHGGDFHQHSTWELSALLPENETADLVAIISNGEETDHDHE